jgi:hypothetical protein
LGFGCVEGGAIDADALVGVAMAGRNCGVDVSEPARAASGKRNEGDTDARRTDAVTMQKTTIRRRRGTAPATPTSAGAEAPSPLEFLRAVVAA